MTLRVGLVAGEPSGDALGAALMRALRARVADVVFDGVGGPAMHAEGLVPLESIERFSINGFVEPLRRLPELLATFRRLRDHWVAHRPDVFVGVDFNVFNLVLERALRANGIRTVHYVSPSVYAWRRGRIARIGRSAELVLTLFPFEPAFYSARGVAATFVGHPLADEVEPKDHTAAARATLGLDPSTFVVALLPGSRRAEVEQHGELFLAAAERVARRRAATFLVPCVDEAMATRMHGLAAKHAGIDARISVGDARTVLAACDAALVKSGTGTLEAMLLGKPMVVAYRLPALSYWIVKTLFRGRYVALPNILADRPLVPELMQHDAHPDALAQALLAELERHARNPEPRATYRELHSVLRRGASARAAEAVLALLGAAR